MTAPYSDRALEALMADLESELVERKESLRRTPPGKDGPIEDIRQAVCAFANDVPGHNRPGVVFVAARDDGTPSGIPITDRLLQRLADIKTDGHTLPPPTMSVEKRVLAGHDVAVVTVHPSDAPPVRAEAESGSAWGRAAPSPPRRTSASSTSAAATVTLPSTSALSTAPPSPISISAVSRRTTCRAPLTRRRSPRTTAPRRSAWPLRG